MYGSGAFAIPPLPSVWLEPTQCSEVCMQIPPNPRCKDLRNETNRLITVDRKLTRVIEPCWHFKETALVHWFKKPSSKI